MSYSDSPTISKILIQAQQGNKAAEERLAKWLMDQVQVKVLSVLERERTSMSESSLISNVHVKLVRGGTIQRAPDVSYLRAAIVKATCEILIDLWRQRKRRQAKGNAVVAANEKLFRRFDEMEWDIFELRSAIEELREIHPRKAMVVELRFICGMSVDQVAQELGVSKSTVEADWRVARVWLYDRLKDE